MVWEAAADRPSPELEGATPLALMRGVTISELAAAGAQGWVDWGKLDFPLRPESTLALMLGVQEDAARQAMRGPLEAVAAGAGDAMGFAYRVNLVTHDGLSVRDNRAGRSTLEETGELLRSLQALSASAGVRWTMTGPARAVLTSPRREGDMMPGDPPRVGQTVSDEDESYPARWFRASAEALEGHPVNDVRVDLGDNPANRAWLWGGGTPADIRRAFLGAPVRARMVTNSVMAEGLAALCRMPVERLDGIWREAASPEAPDARQWSSWLEDSELLVVYVEAPRELGDYGGPLDKVKALDRLDMHLLRPVWDALRDRNEPTRLMLASAPGDGQDDDVNHPVLVWGRGVKPDEAARWDERTCGAGVLQGVQPSRMVARLTGD